MKIKILLFGVTTDLVGSSSIDLELPENATIKALKSVLLTNFPELQKLKSYAVAVNEEYATDEVLLNPMDIVAIIPPVSGG